VVAGAISRRRRKFCLDEADAALRCAETEKQIAALARERRVDACCSILQVSGQRLASDERAEITGMGVATTPSRF